MTLTIFLNLLLAGAASAQIPASPAPAQLTPGAPGFADCPDGVICPILARQVQQQQQQRQVTVIDEDCEEWASDQLPVQQPTTTIKTVTSCPPEVPDCPYSSPTPTVTVCPPEGCEVESSALPVETKPPVCPPEECPECSPDACTPCIPGGECDVCEGCPPPCPEYCPPPGEKTTSAELAPTPTPTPSPTTPAPPTTPSVTLPIAAGERAHAAPGVYLGMAAVFVAVNWI